VREPAREAVVGGAIATGSKRRSRARRAGESRVRGATSWRPAISGRPTTRRCATVRVLTAYGRPSPGNVRGLRTVVGRALILSVLRVDGSRRRRSRDVPSSPLHGSRLHPGPGMGAPRDASCADRAGGIAVGIEVTRSCRSH